MEGYQKKILSITGVNSIVNEQIIQSLWSGYGKLVRVYLDGSTRKSVVAKFISPPTAMNHPRGWSTNISHQRKLRSYKVEEEWYTSYNTISNKWRIPEFIGSDHWDGNSLFVLEDLDDAGFIYRRQNVTLDEIRLCLSWLANFHATHLGTKPNGLWEVGTYWHLATRPEELSVMKSGPLKDAAKALDNELNNCKYQTIVHGDAKLANFCFSDAEVAAVDFQYVGGGCGMKDVAYFIGSCLNEEDCETHESELLIFYFKELEASADLPHEEFIELKNEWERLYPLAWADFTRFLEGWMPQHHKLHSYSRSMVEKALKQLNDLS